MKNLFDVSRVEEIKNRVQKLRPEGGRLWGKMNQAQMLAHCSEALRMALGDIQPPRKLLGRIIGSIIKPFAIGNDEPMRRNSPTVPGLVIQNERDLDVERKKLFVFIDRFAAAEPNTLSKHPHSFFGRLTPQEWAILMYKHLDHHLRQFGV